MAKKNQNKQWRTFSIIFFAFIIFLSLLYLRLVNVRKVASEIEHDSETVPVKAVRIEPSNQWVYRTILGRVEGAQQVDVYAVVSGWVSKINTVRGEEVVKDQTLIELEDPRKTLSLQEAEGRLRSAKANLRDIRRKYSQNKTLFEKGIISRDTLDSLSNQLEAELANVRSLEATYERMRWDLGQLMIQSPIDGKVVEIIPDIGQEVKINEIIAKIVNLSGKKIVAGVDASLAKRIKTGSSITISSKAFGEVEETEGKIIGVSQDIDRNSSTYTVEVDIIANDNNWLPGEVVNLKIPIRNLKNVIRVPITSVLSDSNELFVFLVKDGKSLKVPVEVTWVDDKTGLIDISYLNEGTMLITEGSSGLTNGQKIEVVENQ